MWELTVIALATAYLVPQAVRWMAEERDEKETA